MKKIYWYEPWFFIFFGILHLHRIWGLIDRQDYASFWLYVMESKGLFYFVLMGVLAGLCVLGIGTFFRNLHHNYWWRWIYLCGGGYVLFDLAAIATGWKSWHNLILAMFDVNAPYWNILWGGFILLGAMVFVLGCYLAWGIKTMNVRKCDSDDLSVLTTFNKCLIEDEQSDNQMNATELYHRMEGFLQTEYDAYFFEVDGKVLGYALVKNSCKPLYLRQFYIDRPYRRMHYGEQAFHELLSYLNVDTIDIEVLTWNERGMSFWKKLSFKERSVYMRYN